MTSLAMRTLLSAAILLSSPNAGAVTLSQLLDNDAFKMMILTIANVNRAMTDAANNPMDDYRRQNVRQALSMMPASIVMLAKEFKDGRLHDGDLSFVQGLLGGFMDVNAADNYKKFLTSPNKSLIPAVSSSIPKSLMQGSPQSAQPARIAMDDGQAKNPGKSQSKSGTSSNGSDQLVSLSDAIQGRSSGKGDPNSASITYDDSVKRGGLAPISDSNAGNSKVVSASKMVRLRRAEF